MARTAITIQDVVGPFTTVTAGDLDVTFGASDSVNGNTVACNGRVLILATNTDVGAQTITIDSVDDEKGREDDITAYSLAAEDYVAIAVGLTTSKGWLQSGNVINIDTSDNGVNIAALRLPAGYP
ncbi:MAG: hypothetical protein U9R15_18475 [Chloroflexota bacterium]|nr:hypothetical protein [Chloroflexota bacterium]